MRTVVTERARSTVRIAARAAFVAAVTVAVWFVTFLRPAEMRWGATPVEVASAMPGDLVVGNATFIATRAVTIDAPREDVWPWIVQIGMQDGYFVKGYEANRYMLWLARSVPRLTWCWSLSPVGSRQTRLVTRVRFRHTWLTLAIARVLSADLRNIVTVRQAMLDVKARAEAMARKGRSVP
jgi:hypothetical protein